MTSNLEFFLQKYLDKTKIFKLIESDEGIYFRRIDKYPEDPTEGNREFYGEQEKRIISILKDKGMDFSDIDETKIAKSGMQLEKANTFIQSWYHSEKMSRRMFNDYGKYDKNKDCALIFVAKINLDKIIDDLIGYGVTKKFISYTDAKENMRDGIFTKSRNFAHEQEYRVAIDINKVIHQNPEILQDLPYPREQVYDEYTPIKTDPKNFKHVDEFGFILKVPLKDLIAKIFVPTDATHSFKEKLKEELNKKGYKSDVYCEIDVQKLD